MTGTTTKRVTGAITAGTTRRLTPVSKNVDPWGGAWGAGAANVWGSSWGVAAISLGLAVDATKRVTGAITESTTKRITKTPQSL